MKVRVHEGSCVVGVACQDVHICRGLVAMLMVGKGHRIVHAIAVVVAAVSGEGERHGLGTKAIRSLLTRDDATICDRV